MWQISSLSSHWDGGPSGSEKVTNADLSMCYASNSTAALVELESASAASLHYSVWKWIGLMRGYS